MNQKTNSSIAEPRERMKAEPEQGYEIIDKGSYGKVYRNIHSTHACKVVRSNIYFSVRDVILNTFMPSHPNIIRYDNIKITDKKWYICI